MSLDQEKIKKEGVKLIEEFSKQLEKVPELKETHYVLDLKNVTREDKRGKRRKNFRKKMKRIAPRWEEGYLIAEKGV
jgi:aspartyl-tRNA(Asn)/glutamyl-tRNA(Gln) amidotransferase subunit C